MRLTLKTPLTLFACLLAVASVACSETTDDNGGGGGSGGETPSPGGGGSSKKASELSESEAKKYCEDSQVRLEGAFTEADSDKLTCNMLASFGAAMSNPTTDEELQAACKSALADCLADPPREDEPGNEDGDPCAKAKEQFATCEATLAEIDKCMDDQVAMLKELASADVCAEMKLADGEDGADGEGGSKDMTPASCKALESKCPDLFSDDEEE